eukprot:2008751-Prymnesium_polylepis.1
MIETSPLLAWKHDSSPPSTKFSITSPNVLPSGVVPVFFERRKSKAESMVCARARDASRTALTRRRSQSRG